MTKVCGQPFQVSVYLWPGDSVEVTKGDGDFPSPYIEYEGMTKYHLAETLPMVYATKGQSAVPHEGDILERDDIASDGA